MIAFKLVIDLLGQQVISAEMAASDPRDIAALLVMCIHLNGNKKETLPMLSIVVPNATDEARVNASLPRWEEEGGKA